MNCAIYPRKSRISDKSDSMELQIQNCTEYINKNYPGANIFIYDKDYGFTGHSIEKRKDFQRMLNDVKLHKINVIVVMRYDRLARNMRDFCNIYHELEQNNCNLISISQQIDTSTPYGKTFMYQLASMAELEWSITSERYKDTVQFKIKNGRAYNGKVPYGYKIDTIDGVKRIIKCNEENTLRIFNYYCDVKNERQTVYWVRENIDPTFTASKLYTMLHCNLYIGRCHDNANFCPAYFTPAEYEKIQGLLTHPLRRSTRVYMFSSLIVCPVCGMFAAGDGVHKNSKYNYYRCMGHLNAAGVRPSMSRHISVREDRIEKQLLENLDKYINDLDVIQEKNNTAAPDPAARIKKLSAQLERLNYMFEIGHMNKETYNNKYNAISAEIIELKNTAENIKANKIIDIRATLADDWTNIYNLLSADNKKIFWHNILKKIYVDTAGNITGIDI